MDRLNRLKISLASIAMTGEWNDYITLLLDYYADEVDNHMQRTLVSDLIARYTDVSSQLEVKNKLLQNSDRQRRIAQQMAMLGDWEMDAHRRVLSWSETVYDILELSPTLTPTPALYLQRVHPEDAPAVQRVFDALFSGVAPKEHIYRLQMEDRRVKWVHILYSFQKNTDGSVRTVHGTIQDITTEKQNQDQLTRYNTQLEDMVQEKVKEISDANMATIYALVKLAESRDDDTGHHIERTASYCKRIAERLREQGVYADQIDDDFINSITMASPLHDIGKVGIPDAVLLKPTPLTPAEFEIMKTHVKIGYETLVGLEARYPSNSFLRAGKEIARYHHEKWDGSGYMAGLSGETIPLSARIMALADVYDALRSRRVYKAAFSHKKTIRIIRQGRSTHFDPQIVDVFLQFHADFDEINTRLA